MSYITLGNMRRFLNKLKDYLGKNYLKLTGGTVTGDTVFQNGVTASSVQLTGLSSNVVLVNRMDRDFAKKQGTQYYALLDEENYTNFVPSKTGTGATGTWPINISGNALNDSEGNKIVDTYAKKPELTTCMKKTADSDLVMNNYALTFPGGEILNVIENSVPRLVIDASRGRGVTLKAPSVYIPGTADLTNVTVSTSLTIPGGKIWIV